MPFVQRPHTSLYYESHGEGEPIVLLHGYEWQRLHASLAGWPATSIPTRLGP